MREVGGPPELINNVISMAMITGGIATIIQALGKGPFGSGYLCTEGTDPTFISTSALAGTMGGISLIFGITIVSGVIECLLSRIIHKLRILFPPEVTGVVLAMVGLNIIPIMMTNFFGIKSLHDPLETNNVLVAINHPLCHGGHECLEQGQASALFRYYRYGHGLYRRFYAGRFKTLRY